MDENEMENGVLYPIIDNIDYNYAAYVRELDGSWTISINVGDVRIDSPEQREKFEQTFLKILECDPTLVVSRDKQYPWNRAICTNDKMREARDGLRVIDGGKKD